MKKHIVSALSLALCLGLTAGSAVTVFAEDTKTIDSLKIAFPHMRFRHDHYCYRAAGRFTERNIAHQGL